MKNFATGRKDSFKIPPVDRKASKAFSRFYLELRAEHQANDEEAM
jgi:hypothetical protein